MAKLLDTNHNTASRLPQLKQLGYDEIIRYLSTSVAGEKCVKPAEAKAIADAGLRLGLVFEVWGGEGNFSHDDINAETGAAHGGFVRNYAPTVGAPDGAVIFFAIDTDVTDTQIASLVIPYFRAIKAAFAGKFRVGVYACGAVCAACLNAGWADVAWLSNAMGWNGSRSFRDSRRWALLQHLPAIIAGIDTDPDEVVTQPEVNPAILDSVGFVPFSSGTMPPPPEVRGIDWVQNKLNELGANPPLEVDGKFGDLTLQAIVNYLGDK